MSPRVLNRHSDQIPPNAVYIGRPSIWGNPFIISWTLTRKDVVTMYKTYLLSSPELLKKAREELVGKDLVCFCAPLPCHGDILLEVANTLLDKET